MGRKQTSMAALAGLLLMASPLHAETQAPEGDRTYDSAEKLSTDQKVEFASKAIEEMKSVLAGTLDRLKEAQSETDMVRINCVNDKLSAVKGLVKISEQAELSLREAAARTDQELIDHEYTKITTDVSLVIDPDIRADDPTVIDEGVVPFVEPIEPPDRLPPVSPAG